MGGAEVSDIFGRLLGIILAFGISVALIEGFFASMSGSLLSSQMSIRGDALASAMSMVSMHDGTNISITWDSTPIVIGISEGAFLLVHSKDAGSISPYPAVYVIPGSIDEGEFSYFVETGVSNFSFSHNLGERDVRVG